jgi:hypothetical protein
MKPDWIGIRDTFNARPRLKMVYVLGDGSHYWQKRLAENARKWMPYPRRTLCEMTRADVLAELGEAPETPSAPEPPEAPEAPQAPSAPEPPEAPEAPKEPKAPKRGQGSEATSKEAKDGPDDPTL